MSAREATRGYVFAGGGTGGHIFPALAIAEQLARRAERVGIGFITSQRPIDRRILAERGRGLTPLPAKPFVISPAGLLRFTAAWGPSVRAARARLRQAREHGDVTLVAMGGFVCPPAVRAARAERVPVALVNLDAVPGRANRWVAKRARLVLSACPVEELGWDVVGPIVRAEATPPGDARCCREQLGLDPAAPTLFVSGGSQGARTINELVPGLALKHPDAFAGWQVIHQTGEGGAGAAEGVYSDAGVRASTRVFIERVGLAWGAADLAIARAGAGTVAEACVSRTPTVFLPYPHHADDHQRANARPLEAAGGALVLRDHIDAGRNLEAHGAVITGLLGDAGQRAAMREALAGLGPSDGAARAAARLLACR